LPDAAAFDAPARLPNLSVGPAWAARQAVTIAGVAALLAATVGAAGLLHPNTSFAFIIAGALAMALAIAAIEERGHRSLSLNLFLWALVGRVVVVTVCFLAAAREGGPFLGADATEYFSGGLELAANAFHLPSPAVMFFGSYDVGQYYLFAVMIRYLHADLFGLQVMNCAFTALAAPLTYAIARDVVPRWAAALGVVVALSPSLIGLSAIDLLKDPSIVFALLAFVWLLMRLRTAGDAVWAAGLAVVGCCLALYLRTSRFYVFAYVEAAFVMTMIVMVRTRTRAFAKPQALVLAVLVFLVVEIAPTRALWPTSPVMFVAMSGHTLNTAGMRWSSTGFLQRRIPGLARLPHAPAATPNHGMLMLGIDMVRRVFGPFPWILPRTWTFATLQEGQYYLFPGMLIWYAALPFAALGFALSGFAMLRGAEHRFAVLLLWWFAALYFAQYLLINLSFRQREAAMPILLIFAAQGIERYAPDWRRLPRWYRRYWLALIVVAILHVTVRAILHAS
jgi:hypothetical protein